MHETEAIIVGLWAAVFASATNWSGIRSGAALLGSHAATRQQKKAVARLEAAGTVPEVRAAITALQTAFLAQSPPPSAGSWIANPIGIWARRARAAL